MLTYKQVVASKILTQPTTIAFSCDTKTLIRVAISIYNFLFFYKPYFFTQFIFSNLIENFTEGQLATLDLQNKKNIYIYIKL